MPVVTYDTYDDVIDEISHAHTVSLDLETTGLNPYKGHEIFSAIISTDKQDYYFNFNNRPDHLGNYAPEETIFAGKQFVLVDIANSIGNATVFIHNAKFDQRFLRLLRVSLNFATVICTQAIARLINNTLPSYALSALGQLIGHEKDDSVEKYITKHKLYTDVDVGKKKPRRDKHYNLVPFDIISRYGMQDGRVCFELGQYEMKRVIQLNKEAASTGLPTVFPLVEKEVALTPVLLEMEHTGIKVDKEYCQIAYEHTVEQYQEIDEKFVALTGIEYEDKPKVFIEAFKKAGLEHKYTAKGNPSFSDENLPNNTLGNLIRARRSAYKLAHTYYKNLLDLADSDGVIHCNFRQSGTLTGRMSCSEPNLQNIPKRKEDNNKYPVRGCFVPREGYFFVMIDFDQQEYRLLLDLAGEEVLIKRIKEDGLDVHSATAELCELERHDAKQVNFAQVYGQGIAALAESLGKTQAETKAIRTTYFANLREVQSLINNLKRVVEKRGFIVNPFGRKLLKPPQGSYAIANHYIQGACGDIVKKAMLDVDLFLTQHKSRMLLQIHDELLLEVHESETHLIPKIADIMRDAYTPISLPLTVGVDYSTKNWHQKEPYDCSNV